MQTKKYWLRGALITIVVYVLIFLWLLLSSFAGCNEGECWLWILFFSIPSIGNLDRDGTSLFIVFGAVIQLIFVFGIGSLIGILFGKLKSISGKKNIKYGIVGLIIGILPAILDSLFSVGIRGLFNYKMWILYYILPIAGFILAYCLSLIFWKKAN